MKRKTWERALRRKWDLKKIIALGIIKMEIFVTVQKLVSKSGAPLNLSVRVRGADLRFVRVNAFTLI